MRPLILAVMLCLAGCQSPEQLAAARAAQARADANTCIGFGFQPGTDGFASCRMRLAIQRQQHMDAVNAMLAEPSPAPVYQPSFIIPPIAPP